MLVAGGCVLGAVEACTVPVFRYALDHWPPDAFRLEAPKEWMESDQASALKKLLSETQTEIEFVPTEKEGAVARLILSDQEKTVLWSGALDEKAPELFTSPARLQIANHLLAGESMVWVMVSSGDEEKDKAFEERFKARLEYLASVATIPIQDPTDPENNLGPGPELRVGLSFLKVSRDDAKEQMFIRALAGPDKELAESGKGFGAVVFGRGRILGVWPTEDLDDEGIDEVSLYLLQACSCTVKNLNPGWDLLFAFDWDAGLLAAQMELDKALADAPPSEIAKPVGAEILPEVVKIGADENVTENSRPRGMKSHAAVPLVVSGLVALAGVAVLGCAVVMKGN